MNTCKSCKFYRRKTYQCKRNPPTVITLPRASRPSNLADLNAPMEYTLEPAATFPMLSPDDWCGEHIEGTNIDNETDDRAPVVAVN